MEHKSLPLSLTRHATQRLQQRGIKAETLALLHEFGRRVYAHNGAAHLIFDHSARRRVAAALGKAAARVNFSMYAVVDAANSARVITVGHRTGRCREYA